MQDCSFTCTLFLPADSFAKLKRDPSQLRTFFDINFPGVVPDLISPTSLQTQFEGSPHLPLISIKCTPYHYRDACVIVGDAAHAMVPFYGQGMNAGMEDVRVLFDIIRKTPASDPTDTTSTQSQRAQALEEYTIQRTVDAHTINDLALINYVEMRSSVRSSLYRTRKWIEEHLDLWFPSLGWRTQYSRISFGNQRYSEVKRDVRRQGRLLLALLGIGAIGGLTNATLMAWWIWKRQRGWEKSLSAWLNSLWDRTRQFAR